MRIKWRRLLHAPTVTAVSYEGEVTNLRIDGIVCDAVCARRAEGALAAMPGVTAASVDFDAGTATVNGARHDRMAYETALRRTVAGYGLRRLIERVTRRA